MVISPYLTCAEVDCVPAATSLILNPTQPGFNSIICKQGPPSPDTIRINSNLNPPALFTA